MTDTLVRPVIIDLDAHPFRHPLEVSEIVAMTFPVRCSNKQHAEIHAGSLNSHPYYQKMGFTYHVIEIEVHVRAKRKRLNP